MTATIEPADRSQAVAATGRLRRFNRAGLLHAADVHVAERLLALSAADHPVAGAAGDDRDELVGLAIAFAVRAVRVGSVCVDLATIAAEAEADLEVDPAAEEGAEPLSWPDVELWLEAIRGHRLMGDDQAPALLHLIGSRLYLDRYWREEEQVERDLRRRIARPPQPVADEAALAASLTRLFPGTSHEEQRVAAEHAVRRSTTVLTGGPGTGKTTTVAGILALLAEQAELAGRGRPRIALTSPTGKAAARLEEAVRDRLASETDGSDQRETQEFTDADRERLGDLRASTLHRLLGSLPGTSVRFRHDRDNRLPQDIVVVDETSMMSLTMTARLLAALRPSTILILVGDPDQLASVDAGAVLGDLVEGLSGGSDSPVIALRTTHRFHGGIAELAAATRAGDATAALAVLDRGDDVEFIDQPDPRERLREVLLPGALALRTAALDGDPEGALRQLDRHRFLCAHREGLWGVAHWNRTVERWLADETGDQHWDVWYAGRPVLVTANDYGLGVYNGDVGVAYRRAADGALRVAIRTLKGTLDLPPGRLGAAETMHAMTIHKAQGSEAADVTVLLPGDDSRLLTRELFYTAVTRAQEHLRVVGTAEAVELALDRRVRRATGLAPRLAEPGA